MSTAKQIREEVEKKIQNCCIKKHRIRTFFKYMKNQQKHYKILEFAGNGAFAFVLKALNQKTGQTVALKIVECDESDYQGMQIIEQEYKTLSIISGCKYIVKVFSCFYLTESPDSDDDDEDDNQIPVGLNSNKPELLKVFFIIEQELCQTNLEQYFAICRQQKNYPTKETKELIMIQILDSVAFLHQFNVVHRDIKPSNFLLNFDPNNGRPIVKLCDLAFASQLKLNDTRLSISNFKGTQAYTAPEVFDKVYKKLSDIFSVGIVLIELDNLATFDFSKTKLDQKIEIKQGNIFNNLNLDRQSQIYQIAQRCIKYDANQRKHAIELLIEFIVKNQQYLNVEIFSVINKTQLIQKSEQLSQIQKSVIEMKKKKESEIIKLSQIINKNQHLERLISKFNQLQQKPFQTQEYQKILNELQKITRFDPNFEYISVGATGLILGVFNKSKNRHSALKIQRAQKYEVIREVGIMRDCQMPLVIQLYDCFYLNVNTIEDFVVYEVEKCSGNLKQFFQNLQKEQKKLDENQKINIAIQIMDVVNYLHMHEIAHRDIKLENFLYIEQDSGIPIIKLADFDQARKLSFIWVYDFDENIVKQYYPIEGACGTIGYSSPEQMKDYLSTFKTDIFSVGVCLALIDNFETLEPVLFQKALDYFQNFLIPFQTNQIIKQDVIKRNTQIYEICLKTVVFNQYKRSNLSLIIADYLKQGQPYYSKVLTSINQIQSIPLFQKILSLDYSKNNIDSDGAKAVASEIAKCTNLSTLTLDLSNNNIGSDGAKAVASEIAKCTNLSTLSLYLQSNNIGSDEAKAVASEIAKCTNLSTLSLDLGLNKISSNGARVLALEIAKCINLSNLNLWLYSNNIGSDGAKAIALEIIKNPALQTLLLNLESTNINKEGVELFAQEISKSKNLTNLKLYLSNNKLVGINTLENLFSKNINLKLII